MFERFTDRSRRAVVLAMEAARGRNAGHITTDDLLCGLIGEREGVAATALANLGIAVEPHIEDGLSPSGHIPFASDAKDALELSLREALQLGHNYIGTEHILLALCRTDACPSPGDVRKEVIRLLSTYQPGLAPTLLPAEAVDRIELVRTIGPEEFLLIDRSGGLDRGSVHLGTLHGEHHAKAIASVLNANAKTLDAALDRLARSEPF